MWQRRTVDRHGGELNVRLGLRGSGWLIDRTEKLTCCLVLSCGVEQGCSSYHPENKVCGAGTCIHRVTLSAVGLRRRPLIIFLGNGSVIFRFRARVVLGNRRRETHESLEIDVQPARAQRPEPLPVPKHSFLQLAAAYNFITRLNVMPRRLLLLFLRV